MEQLGSNWTDIDKIWHLSFFFPKFVEEIQVSLKYENSNGILHDNLSTFMMISGWIILKMRNISDKTCRGNQNTGFIFNDFFLENCVVYELKW
jgi:hypothetical protein